ncbi:MAG: transglycosylase SLT domain-containing protein [Gammaproteobacteria bacterium]
MLALLALPVLAAPAEPGVTPANERRADAGDEPGAVLPVALPITLDYAVIERALTEHVFVEDGTSARILASSDGCNELVAARPRVDAADDGRMRVRLDIEARGGTALGARCLLPFTWRGQVELLETAAFGSVPTRLEFRVTDSRLLDAGGTAEGVPTVLWDWVKQLVHPRIEAVAVDLAPLERDALRLLDTTLAAAPAARLAALDSFALHTPTGRPDGLEIILGFDLPAATHERAPTPAPPATPAELAAWEARWQAWDAFATWAIKTLAADEPATLRDALRETLEQARYDLRDALASDTLAADPVRTLFVDTWQRLAPLLASAADDGDTGTALRYLAFTSAGDLLVALDRVGGHLGVRIDRHGLRALARALVAEVDEADLAWDTRLDPGLRALYGLPATPPAVIEPAPGAAAVPSWFEWLMPSAHAAIAARDAWLPRTDTLDAYLARVDALLGEVIAAEEARDNVAARFRPIYRRLVRATAWQESCWRQYVERGGEIRPLQSQAGSVGLMQVNKHVWRGIYDLERLAADVAYNASAGNEILVHYLVDYAIAKKEHETTGDLEALARATYAVYNGGPRHLARYRNADTRASLRAIDAAFWRKYQAIGQSGADAVRACYAG